MCRLKNVWAKDFLAQNILGEEGELGWGEVQFEGLRKALGDVGGVCKV